MFVMPWVSIARARVVHILLFFQVPLTIMEA